MNDTPRHDAPPPHPPPVVLPPSISPRDEPLNPWFSIWVQPRATVRRILDTDPKRLVHVLALAAGASGGLEAHVPEPAADLVPLPLLVAMKISFGALGAIGFLYLFGFLLRLTGGWLNGAGDFVAVRSALAWSMVPNIWSSLLRLPLVAFMGTDALNFDPVETLEQPGAALVLVPITLLTMVVAVWSFVITVKCVAEAHRFSAWHGLGAALLSLFILILPIVAIVFLVTFVVIGMLGLSLG